MTPNIPIPSVNTQMEQIAMTGSLNNESGISGSTALVSAKRNATSVTADNNKSDSTRVEDHPYSVTQVSASSNETMQIVRLTTPAQSSTRLMPSGCSAG